MFRLKPRREEADQLAGEWSADHLLRLEVVLLVLPGAIGLLLVVSGIPDGAYLQVGMGLLLIGCTPLLARRLVRKTEFGRSDDQP